MLSADEVRWAYRYLLGREPESEAVVANYEQVANWQELRRLFRESTEYQSNQHDGALDQWVLARVHHGQRMMWVNLSDRSISYPCLRDDYEPLETSILRRVLKPGDHFVDIGANIGWFSTLASTLVGGDGSVTAFEPRPETFHYLAQTMELVGLGDRARVINCALSDEAGHMNLTWGRKTTNPGGSRLVHGDVPEGQEGIAVELRTLDSLALTACDVIKIDVEGAEAMALRGANGTITAYRPLILSEIHRGQLADVSRCSGSDYIAQLGVLDYDCVEIGLNALGGSLVGHSDAEMPELFNALFIPCERLAEIRGLFVAH